MSEVTKLMKMGISTPQTRYVEMKEAQKTDESKTIVIGGNTERIKPTIKGIRFDENGSIVTGASFSQVTMTPPKDKKFVGNKFVRGIKMIQYKREYKQHLEDVANGKTKYNKCLEYVGKYTPVNLVPRAKVESKGTPVNVTIVTEDGIHYEVQEWEDWHMSVNPTVQVCEVGEVEYSLDGEVNYMRKSPKYTRYATRTIDKENDWEQKSLFNCNTTSEQQEDSTSWWLDNFHMEQMDNAPIEQHQAVLLKKATWVTEIFDDVAYNKVYPQVEVKKVGQMKLELF